MPRLQVLVIDPDPGRRRSIVDCLAHANEGQFEVVAEGFHLFETIEDLESVFGIDVLVINIDMTAMRYVHTWLEIRLLIPGARIVALSEGDDRILEAAFAAAVSAIHPPKVGCGRLRAAVARAGQGILDYDEGMLERARHLLLRPYWESTIMSGGLSIDLESQVVTRWGVAIKLSRLEFRVLACLARNIGLPVSVDKLLAEAWGIARTAGGTDAQVKNCVLRLRKKIEPVPNVPRYIIAHHGRGYFLNDPLGKHD